ncbi:GerMN domain-containing protein [Dactylosporangium matsuzakiense]|uniref:GerMN domain-containing protein n=1 Tax=Dactylosporangium matsuzakiense TaxID=53360 RepID=A0A9W6KD30_9ACTN|nr:GerMN domain-containing protein [Dactylosporangium matsuzakiense]UWZ42230.1 GerMN domain-containing protein [Dactylosporangium matsuzakiense]GLK99881.1 hypothetical protein GCM10017581_016220 [Dactylosporangium matsuzakiense]
MTARAAVVVVGLVLLALAGCGVPAEDSPRLLPSFGPTGMPATAPPAPSPGLATEVLYFVRDGMLVAVRRGAASPLPAEVQLEQLLAGPTGAERDAELTSVLTGTQISAAVHVQGGLATVDIGSQPASTGRSDEVLAYGQIVCTLTSRPDVGSVTFRYDNQVLNVPRADGSLAPGPLTAADYASLLAPA